MARSLTSYLNKNVDNEEYYPATHQHIHQHYNNQQQQQQQQHPHNEQSVVATQQHCNLHKGIVGKQQQQHVYYPKHLQEQQQQPQMRPDYQQKQQQQQQYQNIGSWLPQNKSTLPITTNMNGKIDDLKHHRHHAEHQQQLPHYHCHQQQQQQQQQQIPSNYCSKRLDSNIANGRNSCLIEDVANDFVIGKTFITPPDIPSPPPQPILSDNKRFQSGQQSLSKTTTVSGATTNTLTVPSFGNKPSCCQCEGRIKNHLPLPQQQQQQLHHSNHCHLHQQPIQQQQPITSTPAPHHLNNLPHQYQQHLIPQTTHQHQHQQQHQQQHNEDSIPKIPSALKSQNYHNQQPQQHQQQFHQHQQHYRKVDVFAAASLDDDDNDTSPSIKDQPCPLTIV
ncbi:uncharacterized protein ACRADG_002016 [Cochliomyia hominivorax]